MVWQSAPSGTPQIPIATPRTRAELDALTLLRSELRDQLSSASQRRIELVAQQRIGGERNAAATAPKIAAADERIASLEQQLLAADNAITAGIAQGLATGAASTRERVITMPPPRPGSSQVGLERMMAVNGIGFVLLGAFVWIMLRRRFRGIQVPALADQSRRLEQLQQAVDTVAVEVERISEGQRFVTKLLNERLQPAIGAGEAQQVSQKRADAIPAREPGR